MHAKVAAAIQEIDAAVFGGDTFENPEARVELLEYCARWVRELSETPAPALGSSTSERYEILLGIGVAGKRWWHTARTKANHARMSRTELELWSAIRALMDHDGEDTQ